VAFSPDGALLAVFDSFPTRGVTVWDWKNRRRTRNPPLFRGEIPYSVVDTRGVFTSSRSLAWLTSINDSNRAAPLKLWDLTSGRVRLLRDPADRQSGNWMMSLAASSDGKTFATGHSDGTIKLWDLASGTVKAREPAHAEWIMALKFSPDGRTLGSLDARGSAVKLWDGQTLARRGALGHEDIVFNFAFCPDNKTLLAAGRGEGEKLKLWNIAERRALGTRSIVGDPQGVVYHLGFSADGTTLATQNLEILQGSQVKIWDYDPARTNAD
jgi:WD40 repeat protein